jgi:hypothetical protein
MTASSISTKNAYGFFRSVRSDIFSNRESEASSRYFPESGGTRKIVPASAPEVA